MSRTLTTKIALLALTLTAVVGVVDATLEESWDHAVMFAAAAALGVVLLVSFWIGQPVIRVRRDLFRWADKRSQLTGETVERITDRALAGYRDALAPAAERSHEASALVDR